MVDYKQNTEHSALICKNIVEKVETRMSTDKKF